MYGVSRKEIGMDSTRLPAASRTFDDATMLMLAREIAMDIRPLEQILDVCGISEDEFELIKTKGSFQRYVRSASEQWHSALNAAERVKIKSLSMVEESLPEFFMRMHDQNETLSSKVELLKTVARFAGVGVNPNFENGGGEKMVVTINLGADQQLRIEKDVTPPGNHEEVIEG